MQGLEVDNKIQVEVDDVGEGNALRENDDVNANNAFFTRLNGTEQHGLLFFFFFFLPEIRSVLPLCLWHAQFANHVDVGLESLSVHMPGWSCAAAPVCMCVHVWERQTGKGLLSAVSQPSLDVKGADVHGQSHRLSCTPSWKKHYQKLERLFLKVWVSEFIGTTLVAWRRSTTH